MTQHLGMSVRVFEGALQEAFSALLPVELSGNEFTVKARHQQHKLELFAILSDLRLSDCRVHLLENAFTLSLAIKVTFSLKPLSASASNFKLNLPRYEERLSVTIEPKVQNNDVVFTFQHTEVPITTTVSMWGLDRQYTLFRLDLAKLLPAPRFPVPLPREKQYNLYGRNIVLQSEPTIFIHPGYLELELKTHLAGQGVVSLTPQRHVQTLDTADVKQGVDLLVGGIKGALQRTRDTLAKTGEHASGRFRSGLSRLVDDED